MAFPQVDDLRYSYDPAGNVTRIVNVQGHPNNGAPTRTECFGYDALARLSQAWTATDNCAAGVSAGTVGGPSPYWSSWTFDAVGLRRSQVRHAVPGGPAGDTTTSYNYPPSGEQAIRPHSLTSTSTTGPGGASTTSYGYDSSGNTTGRTLPAPATTPTTAPWSLCASGANISYVQADLYGTAQVAIRAEAIDNHVVTRRSFDPYGNPVGAGQGVWPDAHGSWVSRCSQVWESQMGSSEHSG